MRRTRPVTLPSSPTAVKAQTGRRRWARPCRPSSASTSSRSRRGRRPSSRSRAQIRQQIDQQGSGCGAEQHGSRRRSKKASIKVNPRYGTFSKDPRFGVVAPEVAVEATGDHHDRRGQPAAELQCRRSWWWGSDLRAPTCSPGRRSPPSSGCPHRFVRTDAPPRGLRRRGGHVVRRDLRHVRRRFDEVYERIVDALVDAAVAHGEVLYAVPGSPLVAERTVELLRADERVDGRGRSRAVVPRSGVGATGRRPGGDRASASSTDVVSRSRPRASADRCSSPVRHAGGAVRHQADPSKPSTGPRSPSCTTSGCPTESVRTVDVGRPRPRCRARPPHVALGARPRGAGRAPSSSASPSWCAHCASAARGTASRPISRSPVTCSRRPTRCSRRSRGSPRRSAHLEEELGDLLFQVVFHATLATEAGEFTLADVARGIHDKLVHRHPHVFGDVQADTPDTVMRNWEQIKQAEKGRQSLMDGIPGDLPSLLYAHKVQRKAASVGFDWDSPARRLPEGRRGAARGRGRPRRRGAGRPALRGGQPCPPPEGRPGGGAAGRDREVPRSFPRHGGAGRGARRRADDARPGRARRAVGRSESGDEEVGTTRRGR